MKAHSVHDHIARLFDAEDLGRTLRSAHIPLPKDTYMKITVFVTFLVALLITLIALLFFIFDVSFNVFPFIPAPVSAVVLLAMGSAGVYAALLGYPRLIAEGRKTKIDLDLPYAITYMQALSTTMPLLHIFRLVHEHEDLYGEVSRECGIIVRDVEVFGDDLLSALRDVQMHTPSEAFRNLLNDLGILFRTGGDITSFFASRSAQYRELAQKELEMTLKTMEIMAEVYVTAFVAGPIALIIMMVAQNMSGQGSLAELMPLMYLALPIGAIIMILILAILMPPDHLKITRSMVKETEYADVLEVEGSELMTDQEFLKSIQSKKRRMKILHIIRHPVRHYISDYSYSLIIGSLLAGAVAFLSLGGVLDAIFPEFSGEILIGLLVIALIAPVGLAYEARRWYLNQIEAQLPDFLREISDMKDMGMTLQGAIHLISRGKLGVLSSELGLVSEELKMGASVSNALVRMEERIGLVSVKRAISLIVRASEVTDYLRDILTIAIADLEHYLKMKYERFSVSFVYIAIIYLSFGIFLYSAYQLNTSFISSFETFDLDFSITDNVRDMFHISLILGGFSGIMAGQLSTNTILGGLKHSILFVIASIVLFVSII
jgi:flagellar protein FlaJ